MQIRSLPVGLLIVLALAPRAIGQDHKKPAKYMLPKGVQAEMESLSAALESIGEKNDPRMFFTARIRL